MKFFINQSYFLTLCQVGYKFNLCSDTINFIYKFLLDMNINHIIDKWYKFIHRVNIIPATYLVELNSKNEIFLNNKVMQIKLNLIIDNFNLRLVNSHISKDWWINNLNHLLYGISTNNYIYGDNYTVKEWVLHFYYHNKITNILNKIVFY